MKLRSRAVIPKVIGRDRDMMSDQFKLAKLTFYRGLQSAGLIRLRAWLDLGNSILPA